MLPYDISAYDIKRVKENAHARFDAISRTYQYHIATSKNPFLTEFAYFFPWTLNIDRMNEASERLFNYTDFTSFSKLHTDVKTNNCKIIEAKWIAESNKIVFTITADRFLRNMVRAVVGTIIDVGKERITVDDFSNILEKKNRCSAGVSVPAHGLYLTSIRYPSSIFD